MKFDFEGFRLRLEGKEIKDSMFVALPQGGYNILPLCRQESSMSVTDTFVRYGVGVWNIDGTRIEGKPRTTHKEGNFPNPHTRAGVCYGGYQIGTETDKPSKRFPSNVIFQHDVSCVCEGTKVVKGSHLDHSGGPTSPKKIYGSMVRMAQKGHTDENGMEVVANWNCFDTCPVRELDLQSGILQSGQVKEHYRRNSSTQPSNGGYRGGFNDTNLTGYGDKGGASRFFKQVSDDEELEVYLKLLLRE